MSRRRGQSGYVQKKGRNWYGTFWVDETSGRTRRAVVLGDVTALTKSQARHILREHLVKLGVNTTEHLNRVLQPVILFSTQAECWLAEMENSAGLYGRLKPSTYRTLASQVRHHLLPQFKDCAVTDIGESQVGALISRLAGENGLSKSTIKSTLLALGMVLGRKIDVRDKLRELKVLKPKKSRDILWFSAEEMRKIIGASPKRYRMLFATAAGTGCRAGELYGLHVEDVNLERGFITVRRSVWEGTEQSPKTENAYRTVGIDAALTNALREWIGDRKVGLLFPSDIGTPLRNNAVLEYGLHPVLKSLGIPRRGMHAFRHGRVSMLVEAGVAVNTIKAWIGHGSEKMIDLYTHFRPEYHASALTLVPALLNAEAEVLPTVPAPERVQLSVYADKSQKGVVYYIRDPLSGEIKIGYTANVKTRLQELLTGNRRLELLAVEKCSNMVEREQQRHEWFSDLRLDGEWFKGDERLLAFIASLESTPTATKRKKTPVAISAA